MHPQDLAEQACHIEIDMLKEPVGKQDQYIAAFGGLPVSASTEWSSGGPAVEDRHRTLYSLEDNLLLFFTGYSRSASEVLKEQDVRSKQNDHEMISNLHFVKELGPRKQKALRGG